MKSMFAGVYTALVTPFRDGAVDEGAFFGLVERQVAAGVSGVVVASGAVGEGTSLTADETMTLLKLAVRAADGQIAVISGATSNATAAAVDLARRAEDQGVAGIIVTSPWYTRPSPAGVFQHFEGVASSVKCPVIVGDDPARTCLALSVETLEALGKIANIAGIEDASGNLARIGAVRRACPKWTLLCGDDLSGLGYLAAGGHGLVSRVANVAPATVVALYTASVSNAGPIAMQLNDLLQELTLSVNDEPSPAVTKLALAELSLCEPNLRLPLYACSRPQGRAMSRLLNTRHIQ